ncbi:hypothetical protein LVD17_21530 [Fulvivirga ulvae]|uniref:hypothetical protein n=1 Tax=Fulvivirga ulvae TaxID=2904245 RepID=UPI001F384FAE|nr:hypothetical protein [Fulvivirga ulvae]UII30879.1 hypothetical protein LVD17_21530 [Fulvivirga ulvae]
MASIWIDINCRIIRTDKSWDELARKNKASQLTGDEISGRLIWKYIKGDPARMFLDALITRVRVTGKPYILHYRCDGPSRAQFMKMMVSKVSDGTFHIEHDLIRTGEITPEISFIEDSEAEEKRCAVCGKIQFKGGWFDALTSRRVFGSLDELRTQTVICEACEPQVYMTDIK